ncbi:CaiB/BaiF CoA-transferase family protein [Siccirubricoccus sp. G192]|uniref:CaiB/BaiF CoA transferase family protein n=1 Tax=Siccirubricoccus sp. G192 TaxID=2849651 RepID=UPI0021126B81|nr:CoA transferase [Siccirubricoccus sp. G192]
MSGPLQGVRVLDLTSVVSGPNATMMLADQGADVIKVETPGGDIMRRGGFTPGFVSSNRSKRSIAVDLKQPTGAGILRRLIATADVLVQNFRPGVADRLGFGEAAARAIRPDLVYVSISGVGETGPYIRKRVYDPVIQALSGLADIQRNVETGRPQMIRTLIADKTTALVAAQAITAALYNKAVRGEGQHVRLAMLDAVVAYLWPEGMAGYSLVGQEEVADRAQSAPDLVFRTRDGYIAVGTVSDAEWRGLCRVLEKPEWIDDPRFRTPSVRSANAAARLSLVGEMLAQGDGADWLARLDEAEVPCAPVLTRRELLADPQVAANGLIVEFDQPGLGRIRQARPAARFERTPAEIRRPAPAIGEHTSEILAELGDDEAKISATVAALEREAAR